MNRRRLLPLALIASLISTPALAFEVLVLTTPTRIPARRNRKGVLIQNQGPSSIWCATFNSDDATTVSGVEVASKASMGFNATASTGLYCAASSANQITGAGTRVVEL